MKKLFSTLILFTSITLTAQYYNGSHLEFGKNRIQYTTERIWSFYRFQEFDTYFYQGGKDLAIMTAQYAHQIIPVIEDKLQFKPKIHYQFIIYNSLSDYMQSNVGTKVLDLSNPGGVTNVVGNTIVLYYTTSFEQMKQQIRMGIARVIVNTLLYGDDLTENIKNASLLFLPGWFIEGLVHYLANDWNEQIHNEARNGFLTGKYKHFSALSMRDAQIAGHTFWKYINDTYGHEAIPNIIYLTKVSRSVENGFLYFTGQPFKTIAYQWFQFYSSYFNQEAQIKQQSQFEQLPLKTRKKENLIHIAYSPSGNYTALTTDKNNKKKLYLIDNNSQKKERIFRSGYRSTETFETNYPLVAWHPAGKVMIFFVKINAKLRLYYYNLEEKSLEYINITDLDDIYSVQYAPYGTALLISGSKNGRTNIYLFNLISRTFEPITNDHFDNLYPAFVLGDRYIAFASNRISDTLSFYRESAFYDYTGIINRSPVFNIYLYDFRTRSPVLRRLTNFRSANATMPVPLDNTYIAFLCDSLGTNNLYRARLDSSILYVDTTIHYRYFSVIEPITDNLFSIEQHYVQPLQSKYIQVLTVYGKISVFSTSTSTLINTPVTCLQKPEQSLFQSSSTDIEFVRQQYPIKSSDSSFVRQYRFIVQEDTIQAEQQKHQQDTNQVPSFVLPRMRPYEVEYAINQFISQLNYSFMNTSYQKFTGFGPVFLQSGLHVFLQASISDIMEDYQMIGGVRFSFNLSNNEYFFIFRNNKARLNKEFIFHRQGYDFVGNYIYIQNKQNTAFYILHYPFSPVFSVRNTLSIRQINSYYKSLDFQTLLKPNITEYWGTLKSEFIYDNTRNPQLNIYYGLRWKTWFEYIQLLTGENKNTFVTGFDIRNYVRLKRNFIWAIRFATSTSMGNSKLIYYLGGVDNWLLPRFNDKINVPLDKGYAFQTIATNMRGFDQNIRNGNTFALLNTELRLPVFSYFFRRPIRSEFINHFQIVPFVDIGSAWEGWNPFSKENSLFTHTIYKPPLFIVVRRQKDPIVGGFGLGVRSKVLGYFVRADLGWGVEDGKILKPKFYPSLSFDF